MQELDDLFDRWEKKHKEAGYERFIRDGIVDENWWLQEQTLPKICYFLKEARTKEEHYVLVQDLYKHEPWRLWQRVAVWSQAIYAACGGVREYEEEVIKRNSHEAIRQCSVVNIKKSNGMNKSDEADLLKYLSEDYKELKEELEIINPDVIVCGYTFGMLRKVLKDELDADRTGDVMYGFWKDKLVIDYYHPACHYPNRVNYYALMSICQVAMKEWEERKRLYKK